MNTSAPIKPVRITAKTSAFPVAHGKAAFSLSLRRMLWEHSFDCVAIAFPELLQDPLLEMVGKLPEIYGLTLTWEDETRAFLVCDPCDAYIEAIRQCQQRRIPFLLTEDEAQLLYKEFTTPLEPHLLTRCGSSEYYRHSQSVVADAEYPECRAHRAINNVQRLQELEKKFKKILWVCDLSLLFAVEKSPGNLGTKLNYLRSQPLDKAFAEEIESLPPVQIRLHPVDPAHLYFALGEMPFYTGELEKERLDPLRPPMNYMDLLKQMLLETRNKDVQEEDQNISLTRLQIVLQYVRNLAVQEGRLLPDLYEIITGVKGVFGPYFAAKVLEAAKHYPFFNPLNTEPPLKIGVDKILVPGEEEPMEAVNLLEEEPKYWRTLHLKKEPDQDKQKSYRYQWDPRGMCSHLPEDNLIEGFNQRTRDRSYQMLRDAASRSEAFVSSFKDGLDIRETLRHWYTGDVYVKEQPPLRRGVDTVVVVFDGDHDERYPHRATWYAEHPEESTLTFYATSPMDKLIGPGIAQAEYGGFSLLFPPKPVPCVFDTPGPHNRWSCAEQLLYGACTFSKETHVSLLSFKKPSRRLLNIGKRCGKKIIWIPLARYSQETLRRLRRFHVLNGKQVRSWAKRFIPE